MAHGGKEQSLLLMEVGSRVVDQGGGEQSLLLTEARSELLARDAEAANKWSQDANSFSKGSLGGWLCSRPPYPPTASWRPRRQRADLFFFLMNIFCNKLTISHYIN